MNSRIENSLQIKLFAFEHLASIQWLLLLTLFSFLKTQKCVSAGHWTTPPVDGRECVLSLPHTHMLLSRSLPFNTKLRRMWSFSVPKFAEQNKIQNDCWKLMPLSLILDSKSKKNQFRKLKNWILENQPISIGGIVTQVIMQQILFIDGYFVRRITAMVRWKWAKISRISIRPFLSVTPPLHLAHPPASALSHRKYKLRRWCCYCRARPVCAFFRSKQTRLKLRSLRIWDRSHNHHHHHRPSRH